MSAMNRRDFLKTGGALVVTFTLPVALAPDANAQATFPPKFQNVAGWLKIEADGRVTFHTGKVELGTGVRTALAQLVAEELDVPVGRVSMVMGDTDLCPDQIGTFGSLTIMLAGPQVRQAAAEARLAVIELAAQRFGVPAAQVTTSDGVASAPAGQRATYGELVAGKALDRAVSGKAALKTPDRFKIIGQSVQRTELPAKVCGTHQYIQHVTVPGMLHARVLRPPLQGASPVVVDDAAMKRMPGNPRVVRKGNFIAVVAERELDAMKAAEALRVEWGAAPPFPAPAEIPRLLRSLPNSEKVIAATGDPGPAIAGAARRHEADYYVPFQLHASIGPSCAVADVKADGATVWSATQTSFLTRGSIATLLGMKPEQVRVIWIEGSGCYGQNGADDVSGDAALVSQLVGRPVRVQWSRRDEHLWEPKGTAMSMRVRGGLDAAGNIAGWDYDVWSPNHALRPFFNMAGNVLAGEEVGMPQRFLQAGADRNARPTYVFPTSRVTLHLLDRSPVRASSLRGLGSPQNTFANESFIDELAAMAGADPIEYRIRHLKDERAIEVLRAVGELARWERRPAGGKRDGVGRGVAFVQYDNTSAYVAVAMQVRVDPKTDKVRVEKVWVTHDCGLVVNPDGVRNQIEGNVVQTLSRALFEEARITPRGLASTDWASYPILRFSDLPDEVAIRLIDRPTVRAVGAGEPAASPIFPALANAIFDATGVRLRSVPFTPEKLKAGRAAAA